MPVRPLAAGGALVLGAALLGAPTIATAATPADSTAAVAPPHVAGMHRSGAHGSVYVVQALPDAPVSVEVDGKLEKSTVAPGDILGPLELTPGEHTVTVTGRNPEWTMDAAVTTTAGGSTDIVLHRPASVKGPPKVTIYRNPVASVSGGKGRVMVAHTATVPPADITVDGQVVFANIANGEFATADVPAGDHEVSVVPTGRKGPVLLGPLNLPVEAETLTQVFAVGQPQNGSMDVVVQTLPLHTRGSAAPDRIETGSAGLVSRLSVNVTGNAATTKSRGLPGCSGRHG